MNSLVTLDDVQKLLLPQSIWSDKDDGDGKDEKSVSPSLDLYCEQSLSRPRADCFPRMMYKGFTIRSIMSMDYLMREIMHSQETMDLGFIIDYNITELVSNSLLVSNNFWGACKSPKTCDLWEKTVPDPILILTGIESGPKIGSY